MCHFHSYKSLLHWLIQFLGLIPLPPKPPRRRTRGGRKRKCLRGKSRVDLVAYGSVACGDGTEDGAGWCGVCAVEEVV
ncbi:hypothetical protein GLYMA_15G171050v4 [Glycine max]|nr:hypothetical protein GLYMA_15G171050v4 [Glycine max]KAH1147596.1 hypothetical protein GYH30_042645 [Glycine max]